MNAIGMRDVSELARRALEAARLHERGRTAELVVHDGVLRQSVIALTGGTALPEHNAPHAASIQVINGRVTVSGIDGTATSVGPGELVALTHERHAVSAAEDSAFLLTTVTSVPENVDSYPGPGAV